MNFQPGPQNPSKYPFVGDAYRQWGELPGYVYWPYNDTYYIDPNAARETGESLGLVEPEPEQPGLIEQLAPVAGAAGALYAGKEIGQRGVEGLFNIGKETAPEILNATRIPADASAGLAGSGATAATEGAVSGIGPVADGAAGEALGSEGLGFGASLGPALQGTLGTVGLGLGAKGVYDAYEDGSPLGGAISGAGAGLGASALGGALGLAAVPGVGWLAGGGALLGAGLGLLGDRETTIEHQQKLAQQLASRHKDDALYQRLVAGNMQAIQEGPKDPGKPYFSGKYGTWDEYKAAGLNAQDLSGQVGVLEAVGGLNLTLPQIHQVTQQLINNDMLYSEKGAVKVTDPVRARQIAEQIKAGGLPPESNGQPQEAPLAPQMEGSNTMPGQRPIQTPQQSQGLFAVGSSAAPGSGQGQPSFLPASAGTQNYISGPYPNPALTTPEQVGQQPANLEEIRKMLAQYGMQITGGQL